MISVDCPRRSPSAGHGDPELAGRSMLVQRLTMLPIECVVRGYLAGSGWKDYQATGAVCGHSLPPACASPTGCRSRSSRRPPRPPRATTSTSTASDRELLVGEERVATARASCRSTCTRPARPTPWSAASSSPTPSSSSASTPTASWCWATRLLTPDSSRFWPADGYAPGGPQPSFDKQYVRDWLETLDWDKTPPGPELPRRGRRGHAGAATSRRTSGSPGSRSATTCNGWE